MFGQMTGPEVPNQMYQELIHTAEREHLARRVARERRVARRLERQAARQSRRQQLAQGAPGSVFRRQVQRLVPRQVG